MATCLQVEDVDGNPVDNPKLALIELICIAYFTVEFLLRLAGAPQKIAFLKNTMNIVDCAAILPYYITLFFMPADDFGPLPSSTTTTAVPELARLVVNATVGPAEEEEDGILLFSTFLAGESGRYLIFLSTGLFSTSLSSFAIRIAPS